MNHRIITGTPGSSYEEVSTADSTMFFAYEPDPDYGPGARAGHDGAAESYLVGVRHDGREDGTIFFASLERVETFARELLAYAKRHRKP